MPKKSVVHRNKKRVALVQSQKEKRDELRKTASNIHLSEDERYDASEKLQKLSRDGSPSRTRNRCNLCGRPRAYTGLVGLCRIHFREEVLKGRVTGVRKASW